MEKEKSEMSARAHNNQLIQKLLDCALTCEDCATQCLNEDDVSAMAKCVKLDRDCADICFLLARLLTRGSQVAHAMLAQCEEICQLCAEECSRHDAHHCRICASTCRTCAEECHMHHGAIFAG